MSFLELGHKIYFILFEKKGMLFIFNDYQPIILWS